MMLTSSILILNMFNTTHTQHAHSKHTFIATALFIFVSFLNRLRILK